MELAARSGTAIRLAADQDLVVVNTHGLQVVDTWALAASDSSRFLSATHTIMAAGRLIMRVGDELIDSTRRPLLRLIEDTSPGDHDLLIPSCDIHRYRSLGVEGYHDNCHDNYLEALAVAGIDSPGFVPQPFNLFMRVPVAADGVVAIDEPRARPGDRVRLRALEDVVVILSACPQDLAATNGSGRMPTGVSYEIEAGGD